MKSGVICFTAVSREIALKTQRANPDQNLDGEPCAYVVYGVPLPGGDVAPSISFWMIPGTYGVDLNLHNIKSVVTATSPAGH